jgi:hypothetical protein
VPDYLSDHLTDHVSQAALIVHAGTACFMAGLIWFVQIVHYPLMRMVAEYDFAAYQRAHQARVTRIVAPVMFLEAMATALILLAPGGGVTGDPLRWTAAMLLVVSFATTFGVMVPLHAKLARGPDARGADGMVLTRLVRLNWIRTIAWSARAMIGLALLV